MPKETKARNGHFDARSRASPYPQIGSSSLHRGSSSRASPDSPTQAKDIKEWDEVRCPVCMEHPHNAVRLLCTSGDKGCHPFMCDTSYRHSNCLDQYKKAFSASSPENMGDNLNSKPVSKLSCPLCRGGVTGWTVEEPARRYMNSKVRSCSKESCRFTGSYGELRKHARIEHPLVRPSEADPNRELDWRRMEQERDMGDLFSTFRSAMGEEYGGMGFIEEDGEILASDRSISTVAVYLILRVRAVGPPSGTIRASVRSSRGLSARVSLRSHRGRATALWGEPEPEPAELGDSASLAIDIDDEDDGDEVQIVGGGGDDDSASDEVNVGRRSGPGRHRRQLRMSPEELDEDDWL